MSFKKPEFYKLFENHIRESLELLSKYDITEAKILVEPKTYEIWFLVLNNMKEFQDLDSFLMIKNWLKDNPWFENHFNHHVGFGTLSHPMALDDILRRRVYDHILESGLIPNTKTIERMYDKFEKFLVSKKISFRLNIYLSGLKCEKIVEIEPRLEIHGLTMEQQHKYNKNLNYYDPHVHSIIVYGTEFPKIFRDDIRDSQENYSHQRRSENTGLELIEALRIFKSGRFGATKIVEESPFIHDQYSKPTGYGIERKEFAFMEGDEYVLKIDEIDEFRSFWKKYRKVKGKKHFSFLSRAVRRFMDTYERDGIDDPVIDLMIALEIMFTPKKTEYGEMNERISKFLHPEDLGGMKKTLADLELVRRLRHDIVHGGERIGFDGRDGKKVNFMDIADRFEQVVRLCLRKSVELLSEKEFTKEQFIKYLDEM